MRFTSDAVLVTSVWANQQIKDLGITPGDATIVEHSFDENPHLQLHEFLYQDSKLKDAVSDKKTLAVVTCNQSSYDDLFARLAIYHAKNCKDMYIVHLHCSVALENWQDEKSAKAYTNFQIEKIDSKTICAMRSEVERLKLAGRSLFLKIHGMWQALPDGALDDSLVPILLENADKPLNWVVADAKCEIERNYHFELSFTWILKRLKYLKSIYL